MKILLIGDYKDNGGPTNVNRMLIEHSNRVIRCIKSNGKIMKNLEIFWRIITCDFVLISGYNSRGIIYTDFAHFFKKKVLYLMHGCVKYENQVNHLLLNDDYVNKELIFLKKVDLVLGVSEKYSQWVINYYPELIEKVSFLNNGIDRNEIVRRKKTKHDKYIITLTGGNRIQKNNLIICEAVEALQAEGYNIQLNLFGRTYNDNEIISSKNIQNHGMVPRNQLLEYMCNSDLYICNSYVESFGLSVIDAIFSGCDIIINDNIGASSIFKIKKKYVISDIHSVDEIKKKILYVMKHHNNEDILNSIPNDTDYQNCVKKLVNICKKMKD